MLYTVTVCLFTVLFLFISRRQLVFPLWIILGISFLIRLSVVFVFASSMGSDTYGLIFPAYVYLQRLPSYPLLYFPFIIYFAVLTVSIGKFIAPFVFFKLFFSLLDVGVTYFVYKLSKNPVSGLLYAVNPIMLIVISIHGQIDTLPLFFLLWSISSVMSGHEVKAAVLLGLSIAGKDWPLLFFAPFLTHSRKPWLFSISLLIPALTVLIYALDTQLSIKTIMTPIKDYRGIYTVWGIGSIMGVLTGVWWDEAIRWVRRIFLVGYGLWSLVIKNSKILPELFLTMLGFFFFSPLFGSQWLSWLVPFMIILRPKHYVSWILLTTLYLGLGFIGDTDTLPYKLERDVVFHMIGLVEWWMIATMFFREYRQRTIENK